LPEGLAAHQFATLCLQSRGVLWFNGSMKAAKPDKSMTPAHWVFLALALLATGIVIIILVLDGIFGLRLLWNVWTAAAAYAFLVLLLFVLVRGLRKVIRQRNLDIHELDDENVVNFDPDGERKLHEYLTAITSTEARIGLIQTSEPWPGPEMSQAKTKDDDHA
jgi:hypothetical protein